MIKIVSQRMGHESMDFCRFNMNVKMNVKEHNKVTSTSFEILK